MRSSPTARSTARDVSPILLGQPNAKNPHEAVFFYANGSLHAVRAGRWKYKDETTLQDETEYGKYEQPEAKIPPALFDLELDPTEQKNVANNHADIVERMKKLMQAEREELGDLRLHIEGKGVRRAAKSATTRARKPPHPVPNNSDSRAHARARHRRRTFSGCPFFPPSSLMPAERGGV